MRFKKYNLEDIFKLIKIKKKSTKMQATHSYYKTKKEACVVHRKNYTLVRKLHVKP